MPTPGQPGGHTPGGHLPGGHLPDAGGAAASFAALSGTALFDLKESGVVAGGRTIIIELINETWIADISAQRQAIIDGITSVDSETLGWNNEVRDKEVVGSVVRTSAAIVTVTLTAAPAYQITENELIQVTIPAAALSGAVALIAQPGLAVAQLKGQIVGRRGRKPTRRKISIRSVSHAISGVEQAYPVYRFSDRDFIERPKHNPFSGL